MKMNILKKIKEHPLIILYLLFGIIISLWINNIGFLIFVIGSIIFWKYVIFRKRKENET